jgi:hypothetical protein
MTNEPQKPIDKVTRIVKESPITCGVNLPDKVLDLVIDLVELIEDKGDTLKFSEVMEVKTIHHSHNPLVDLDYIIHAIREATFHQSDEDAQLIIDRYLEEFPQLLDSHSTDWYYKHC